MSLLKQKHSNLRRAVLGLALAALLLAVPCVAAAALAIHFNIDSPFASAAGQEPSRELQEKRQLDERKEQEIKARWEKETAELKQRIATETDTRIKAELEKTLAQREKEKITNVYTVDGGGYAVSFRRNDDPARLELERQERGWEEKRNTELARAAKISMDQAIQIATSKTPGKVLECSLVGEHWEGPGELSKPAQVLYHVVILSGDDATPVTMHVLVNAVDGTIFRTEKEQRRTEAPYMKPYMQSDQPRSIEGGVLNGKATALPVPAYPDIARNARAQGTVEVRIMIDEGGNVIEAQAVAGHPLLRAAAVTAAREAKFNPTRLSGEPVRVSGVLTYNFMVQ